MHLVHEVGVGQVALERLATPPKAKLGAHGHLGCVRFNPGDEPGDALASSPVQCMVAGLMIASPRVGWYWGRPGQCRPGRRRSVSCLNVEEVYSVCDEVWRA